MKTLERFELYDWLLSQVGDHRFGKDNPNRKNVDVTMRKNGNLNLVVSEDVELVIKAGLEGVDGYIFVPKGAEVTVYRHPETTAPNDTVATIFVAGKYQASLRGNRRTFVRRY